LPLGRLLFIGHAVRSFEETIMDFNFAERPIGEQLGIEGFDQFIKHAEAVCECERQRIELVNHSLITAKKAEYASELEKADELKPRVYQARPLHEHRTRRRRIIYCWSVAAVLIIAGFVLAQLTLEPFQLGRKSLFYCLGIAISVPYLVETTLDRLASEKLIRVLVTVSSIVALISLMTLAVIRGQLLAKHTQEDSSAVVIDGEETQNNPSKASFYDDTVPLLQIVMVLLAFSMEVGAGIALHEAERVSANLGESHEELQRARAGVQAKLALLVQEIMALQSEPAVFVTKFWRDFHWAVLKRSIGNAAKVGLVGVLFFLFLSTLTTNAQQRVELVVLIDLSRSVGANGPDDRSEFQKNVAAVSQVLRQVPAGAHVTILGITDDSFAQPYFLLRATVASEAGYFGEKLTSARQRLETTWKTRSRNLTPSFAGTDLFGAFLVAGQIFQEVGAGRRDVLVVFSDMWQETREFNFGRATGICAPEAMEKVRAQKLLANLRDAEVEVLGTDAPGRNKAEWACVRDFWMKYLAEAGAKSREYSVMREPRL
jgi:hypothetical protein